MLCQNPEKFVFDHKLCNSGSFCQRPRRMRFKPLAAKLAYRSALPEKSLQIDVYDV
jgi:hypothetical protein